MVTSPHAVQITELREFRNGIFVENFHNEGDYLGYDFFRESSAVNYISEKGLSGEQFVDILEKKSLVPVIGRYTTLELAKDILHDKVEPVKKLFYFVKSLNSIFACRRDQLYKMEEHKLRNNLIVNWQTNQEDMKIINGMIDRFCKGQFNDDDRLAIKNREIFMDSNRQKNWSTPQEP